MLTRIKIRHFKLFEEVELDLGQHVVLAGPNNSGKTSLLQAIALWEIGLKKWLANKSREIRTTKRLNRITINRNDLIALPVPSSDQLWHQLQMRSTEKTKANKAKTNRLLIEITVHGLDWPCGFGISLRKFRVNLLPAATHRGAKDSRNPRTSKQGKNCLPPTDVRSDSK